MSQELDIRQGTVSFWINQKAIDYTDGKLHTLAQINPNGGSIIVLKDEDNKLKVFYVAINIGRVDLEYDVSKLSSDKHLVTFTWNLKDRIVLYLDGEPVASSLMTVEVASNTCMFNVLFPLVLNEHYFHVYSRNNEIFTDISLLDKENNQWIVEVKANEAVKDLGNFIFKRDIEKDQFVFELTEGEDKYSVEIKENNLSIFKNNERLLENIRNNTINGSDIGIKLDNSSLAIGAVLPRKLKDKYISQK